MSALPTGGTASTMSRIEVLGFRSLRYVSQRLRPFQVLVGPNASGKSAFLDVVIFLRDLQRAGLKKAIIGSEHPGIPMRATDPRHLTWMQRGGTFELALEAALPDHLRDHFQIGPADVCRYETAVDVSGSVRITAETLWLKPDDAVRSECERLEFPNSPEPPERIIIDPGKRAPAHWKRVFSRGSDPEQVTCGPRASGRPLHFRIAADRAALTDLPAYEGLFPVVAWFRQMLTDGVQRIALSGEAMRRPSSPAQSDTYLPDGSNLPHVVQKAQLESPERYADWMLHVREALPDIERITVRVQPWDGYRYLVIHYRSGLEAPSWLVSEGTLRFLALTLLAYLPDPTGPYLIEEPENGIHPHSVETVFQSLSSVYDAQVLLATHSPDLVRLASADQMLCFARDERSGTDVVAGPAHPRLQDWHGVMDLGTLQASGVLG